MYFHILKIKNKTIKWRYVSKRKGAISVTIMDLTALFVLFISVYKASGKDANRGTIEMCWDVLDFSSSYLRIIAYDKLLFIN